MKRSTIACICVLMSISLTSLWAVWEGNAGIAAASEFPGSGMYARSDMFPKNTIVEILNLEKDITVRVVITGSSNVPGLVAVISPDTATALNIKSGSVSRVRISIPSPVTERPAAGTVSTGTGTEIADPDINPSVAASTATTASPLQTAAAPSSAPLVPLPLASTAQTASVYDEPTVVPSAETTNATAVSPATSETVTTTREVATTSEGAQSIDSVQPVTQPVVATTPAVPVTTNTVESVSSVAATSTEVAPTPTEVAPVPAVIASPEVLPATEELTEAAVVENTAVAVESTPADATTPAAIATVPIAAVSEVTPSPEVSVVTLVPAEPKPPVVQESTVPSSIPVVEPVLPMAIETAPVQGEKVTEVTPSGVNARPITNLPYINSLSKGSYYIQIASYSDPVNAQKVVDTFGKKYPVVIERTAAKGGDVLKVFIGPVHKDEYGAVLERFKLLGYKDAFVKKGQ